MWCPFIIVNRNLLGREQAVQCDDTHECQDGQTCCKLKNGEWGCCPLPQVRLLLNAVTCSYHSLPEFTCVATECGCCPLPQVCIDIIQSLSNSYHTSRRLSCKTKLLWFFLSQVCIDSIQSLSLSQHINRRLSCKTCRGKRKFLWFTLHP
jgi:hypothetical protein